MFIKFTRPQTPRRLLSVAVAALALIVFAPAVIEAAARTPFLVVDGDGWLTSNANHDGGTWTPINPARPAFGLQLSGNNDLPFDQGTAGATFWVRNAKCGARFTGFGEECGWQLGLAVTQFRSIVVGGHGIEIDGLGANPPYGRVINSSDGQSRLVGLLTNEFVDFSGVDANSAPSWFAGFDLDRDAFALRRMAPGGKRFDDLLTVDREGDARLAGSLAVDRPLQRSPNQWATRAHLAGGTFTFRYAKPFAQPPVCVATSEGTAHIRVAPATSECTVTSENPTDDATIDLIVIGNPQ
jgi:hypothetical protein